MLTLAYMNAEALRLTLETREVHFWSRSRQELWRKGETSGNTLALKQLRLDCDEDALVALAIRPGPPATPASARAFTAMPRAATRAGSPRFTRRWRRSSAPSLDRQHERPEGSYTVELLDDPAGSPARSARRPRRSRARRASESDERVAEEAADVLYHLSVLLRSRDVSLADVLEVLDERRR